MNKRDAAILEWVRKNRPDIDEDIIRRALADDGFCLLTSIAFEAGRQFQEENPDAPHGGHAYL